MILEELNIRTHAYPHTCANTCTHRHTASTHKHPRRHRMCVHTHSLTITHMQVQPLVCISAYATHTHSCICTRVDALTRICMLAYMCALTCTSTIHTCTHNTHAMRSQRTAVSHTLHMHTHASARTYIHTRSLETDAAPPPPRTLYIARVV